MTSRIELEIDAPQARAAELMADPSNMPRWMDDIDRIEPISGQLGEPGSVYRMVPKQGTMVFVATVVTRALPSELRLSLNDRRVSVSITDRFEKRGEGKTKMISEEIFAFKGWFGRIIGILAGRSIRAAHRRHMDAFKRFAERTAS